MSIFDVIFEKSSLADFNVICAYIVSVVGYRNTQGTPLDH